LVLASLALVSGSMAVAACVGDENTSSPSPDAGAFPEAGTPDTSSASSDSGPPPVDAGADAEEIADGGGLPPEDDAGLDTDAGLDAGVDAGPACTVLTPGAFVTSTCVSRVLINAGGTLTTTDYQLTGVAVLGSTTFCGAGGGFAAYDHRGGLRVTAKSATTATFEFLDQYKKAGAIVRPTSVRYDVEVSAASATLTYTPQACAAKPAPAKAGYSVTTDGKGKKVLILRLPYGTGYANYRFTEL
jgi:hypothetical protein